MSKGWEKGFYVRTGGSLVEFCGVCQATSWDSYSSHLLPFQSTVRRCVKIIIKFAGSGL